MKTRVLCLVVVAAVVLGCNINGGNGNDTDDGQDSTDDPEEGQSLAEISLLFDDWEFDSGDDYDFLEIFTDGNGGDQSQSVAFTIQNDGTEELTLSGIALSGQNAVEFDLADTAATNLAPGSSTTFSVVFDPLTTGVKSALITISSNDADESEFELALIGTGYGVTTVDASADSGGESSIATDGSIIHLAYSYSSFPVADVKYAKSTDGGNSWLRTTIDETDNAFDPSIAISGNDVYVAYTRYDPDPKDAWLMFARSTDKGETWPSANIREVDSADTGYWPSLVLESGVLHVAYVDRDAETLRYARSTDGGDTWPVLTPIVTASAIWHPSLAVDGNTLYVSYYDESSGDLELAKSTDGGANWPSVVTVDSTDDVGYASSVVADQDDVFVAYVDRTSYVLRFARSTDAGATWPLSNKQDLDSTSDDSAPALVLSGGTLYVTHHGGSGLEFLSSTDGGVSWSTSAKRVIDDGHSENYYPDGWQGVGENPSLAVDGDAFYVSYYNRTSEDLMFARSLNGGLTW